MDLEKRVIVESFIRHLHSDFEEGRLSDCLESFGIPCVIVDFANQNVDLLQDNPALRQYLDAYYQAYLAMGVATRDVSIRSMEKHPKGRVRCEVILEERTEDGQLAARSRIVYQLAPLRGSYIIELAEIREPHPSMRNPEAGSNLRSAF